MFNCDIYMYTGTY